MYFPVPFLLHMLLFPVAWTLAAAWEHENGSRTLEKAAQGAARAFENLVGQRGRMSPGLHSPVLLQEREISTYFWSKSKLF